MLLLKPDKEEVKELQNELGNWESSREENAYLLSMLDYPAHEGQFNLSKNGNFCVQLSFGLSRSLASEHLKVATTFVEMLISQDILSVLATELHHFKTLLDFGCLHNSDELLLVSQNSSFFISVSQGLTYYITQAEKISPAFSFSNLLNLKLLLSLHFYSTLDFETIKVYIINRHLLL